MNATFETVMRLSEEVEQAESDEKYKRKADEKWAAIGAVLEQGAEDDKFRVLALLVMEHHGVRDRAA